MNIRKVSILCALILCVSVLKVSADSGKKWSATFSPGYSAVVGGKDTRDQFMIASVRDLMFASTTSSTPMSLLRTSFDQA